MGKYELYYKKVKEENKDKLVLIRYGKFYRGFEDDALILWSLFNYKLNINRVGFPTDLLEKVLEILRENNIDVVLISEQDKFTIFNNTENWYLKSVLKAKEKLEVLNKNKTISELVTTKLDENINNYDKLIGFINEL